MKENEKIGESVGPVRLALIGAGGFGAYTTELFDRQPEIQLVGVADVVPELAERLGTARGVPFWTNPGSCWRCVTVMPSPS